MSQHHPGPQGTAFQQGPQPQPNWQPQAPGPQHPPQGKKSRKPWIYAAGVLTLITIGFGMGSGSRDEALEDAEVARAEVAAAVEAQESAEARAADAEAAASEAVAAASEATSAAEQSVAAAEFERDAAVDTARAEIEAEFVEREAALAAQQEEVEQREAAVSTTESTIAASTFPDGNYIVGVDIPPGRYRSSGQGDSCYWERLTADGSDIIDNYIGNAPAIATVREGELFQTTRCGVWSPAGS